MSKRDEIQAYQARWAEVEAFITLERRTASLDLRWMQLNSAYRMGKELGLLHKDPSEMEVIERWAWLKEKLEKPPAKA